MTTDHAGGVYHFDAEGVHDNAADWTQCLAVSVVTATDLSHCWNTLLMEFCTSYQRSQIVYVSGRLLIFSVM